MVVGFVLTCALVNEYAMLQLFCLEKYVLIAMLRPTPQLRPIHTEFARQVLKINTCKLMPSFKSSLKLTREAAYML